MDGPKIFARSISIPSVADKFGNHWQYHSRSDQHSKVACWALLFDLLHHCPLLKQHITDAKVGFGINHEMRDFRSNRKKYLDLVLCTPGTSTPKGKKKTKTKAKAKTTFADLAQHYAVDLTPKQRTQLAKLPILWRAPVGTVLVALEAKATMTEHVKALPRLFDELNSSQLAIHGSADFSIAVGFAIVNHAPTFVSPIRNKYKLARRPPIVNQHNQPNATERTLEKVQEIPRRTQGGAEGFDALGILLVDLANDSSPARIVTRSPAPSPADVWHYDQMIRRIASLYAHKFGNL